MTKLQSPKGPTFTKRVKRDEIMVRVWVDKKLQRNFKAKVLSRGLMSKDVFNDFMKWFVEQKDA